MRTIIVTETKDVRRRANGAVSFFKGSVEVDGHAIREFNVQLKATDEGADDVRLDGGVLTMPEVVAARVLGEVRSRASAVAAFQANVERQDDEKHGYILRRLLPVAAVSDAQRDFAERTRRAIVIQMSEQVGDPVKQEDAERAALIRLIWDCVTEETAAKFWLDDARGRKGALQIFVDRARAAFSEQAA